MSDEKWFGWIGLIIAFVIYQLVRAVLRGARGTNGRTHTGVARLNAAAERILKARGASVANPVPRARASGVAKPAAGRPRGQPDLTKAAATPAVIRRSGLLSGKEPVVQRRH